MEDKKQVDRDEELKYQFVKAIFRGKQLGAKLVGGMRNPCMDISFVEIALMHHATNPVGCLSGIKDFLFISKPAISQMLGKLEKKGYLVRETDRSNRRKVNVSLTDAGMEALISAQESMDEMVSALIDSLGEQDAYEFIRLMNKFSDAVSEYQNDKCIAESEK